MASLEKLTSQQTRDMESKISDHIRALKWDKKALKSERKVRLKQLLHYAKKHSPWYKEKLAKIDINDINENNLQYLPLLDKPTLMANWDKIITVPGITLDTVEDHIEKMYRDDSKLYFLERYHVMVTGGSSGRRGVFIYDWDEWNDYYLTFRRYRLLQRNLSNLLNTKRITLALVSSANLIHGIFSLAKTFNSRYTNFIHFPLSEPTEKTISGLNSTQPDVLQGSPFSLYRLAQFALTKELKIDPETVNVFAEPFHPELRNCIEKAWPNAGVFNTYGTSEGLTALCCTENRKEMHLNDDLCIVEPINADGTKTRSGQISSKIYITNLYNKTLPLIRYQIDDELLLLDKTCDCGIQHQLIEEPLSRPEFDFTYKNNVLVRNIVFTAVLLQERNVQEYQVYQTENGVDIKLMTKGIVEEVNLSNKLNQKLSNLGINSPVVNIDYVDKFVYPASGKLKRFIPLSTG